MGDPRYWGWGLALDSKETKLHMKIPHMAKMLAFPLSQGLRRALLAVFMIVNVQPVISKL